MTSCNVTTELRTRIFPTDACLAALYDTEIWAIKIIKRTWKRLRCDVIAVAKLELERKEIAWTHS